MNQHSAKGFFGTFSSYSMRIITNILLVLNKKQQVISFWPAVKTISSLALGLVQENIWIPTALSDSMKRDVVYSLCQS